MILALALALSAPSFAQEPPSDAPLLSEGISKVPSESYLLLKKKGEDWEWFRIPSESWLLPDSYYEEALTKAKQLEICQPALDSITEETLHMADRTYEALSTCGDQFDVDEELIADLTSKLQSMETRALVAEDRLKTARKNQAVAWAITGGVVLGASSAIVVTLAN